MAEHISIGFGETDNDVACRQTVFFDIIESVISKEPLENTKEEINNCIYKLERHFKKYNLFLTSVNVPIYESWNQEDMINYIADTCTKITNKNILNYDPEEDFIIYIDTKWFSYFKSFIKNIIQRFNKRLEMLNEEQDRIVREETRKIKHNEDVNCECGSTYTKSNKQRHMNSIEHTSQLCRIIEENKKSPTDILNCPCGSTYTRSNFSHHKNTSQHKYYIEHNAKKPTTEICECGLTYEIINKSNHLISSQHYEKLGLLYDATELKHKQKRLEYNKRSKEQISCECGGKYTKCHMSTHYKSKKHTRYMISITLKNDDTDKK